jgi:hypothetical protein
MNLMADLVFQFSDQFGLESVHLSKYKKYFLINCNSLISNSIEIECLCQPLTMQTLMSSLHVQFQGTFLQ